jgi:transmembrane sensor
VAAGFLTWFAIQRGTYTTEIGERRSITLSDGSTIDLNARSKVRIHFSKAERDVELVDGQALFEVAKDKARPFVVKSGDTQVRAVGTQFDVYRKQSGTTVTVIEGRVEVRSPESALAPTLEGSAEAPIFVSAGEQITVTAHRLSAVQPKRTDVAAATAWTHHRLVFDGSRLGDVVVDFNRYNTRQLVIETPDLQDFHVSGVYSSTDPASLVRFLRAQPGMEISETGSEVRIAHK